MQKVSQEYKDSMKSLLRNRAYMRIVFGGSNSLAQNVAEITGDQLFYSNPSKVFDNGSDDYIYATLENDFAKVNGSMYFDPLPAYQSYQKSFISDDVIDENGYNFIISFGNNVVSFDSMLFDFGDNYPVDFTITDNNGNVYTCLNTTGRLFTIEQTFEHITTLEFRILSMVNEVNRFRLYSVRFDSVFEYQNDMILDSTLDSVISPIGENIPQMNFEVKLVNEDHRFDVDNPKSILYQFNTDTEVNVYYGYQLSDHIEWLQAAKLFVEKWNSDRESATIYARDILQNIDKLYTNGTASQTSLYDLAVDVLNEMGITDYNIDPELSSMFTKNPIPAVPCKEALQIIANAGCKKFFIKRDGSIKIGDDIYSYEYSTDDILYYSNIDSIGSNDEKSNYATLENNFTKVNGTMFFNPYEGTTPSINVGYVSETVSNNYGLFKNPGDIGLTERVLQNNVLNFAYELNPLTDNNTPLITVTLPEENYLQGVHIIFGDTYATKFIMRCFLDDVLQEQVFYSNDSKEVTVDFANGFGNRIEIEFIETAAGNTRVRVNFLEVLRVDNVYNFEDVDMITYPKFNKFETIQKISVPYYSYQYSSTEEKLLEETIVVTDILEEFVFTLKEPATNYRYSVSAGTYTIVKSSAYGVTVKFSSTGSRTFTIYGYKYTVSEQTVEEIINETGSVINWENPLMCTREMAVNLLTWLKEYYLLEGYYEFDTRGNPEIDVNDDAIQKKYTGSLMDVLITDITLNFNGAFSGSVKTLKKGDAA